MAVTFVVNPGSTSRKYALYKDGTCLANFVCETTGNGFRMSVVENGIKIYEQKMTANQFTHSASQVVTYILEKIEGLSIKDITHVGIRVVAPGTYFTSHRVIDEVYVSALKKIEDVAPLHVPGLLDEIKAVSKVLPDAFLYGVSDSAFHSTIPDHIRTVSITKADAQKYDIYRFGYHGISFSSITRKLEAQFGEVPKRTVVCHIGGGISIVALKNGESLSTSMGYSPVSGIMMGSRGGDITAGVVAALTVSKDLKDKKLYDYLYKESGFKGVAGVSDLRMVLERKALGDPDAILAIDMFVHQLQSWIGAHMVTLGGLDALVLTATAPERNPALRSIVLAGLSCVGIEIDKIKNEEIIGREGFIHANQSSVKVAVIKTDEMNEIQRIVLESI